MKFTKMSLVAALLVGTSAFAIDNVKVSGDAKLFYSTDDADYADVSGIKAAGDTSGSMFSKQNSAGQAALGLGLTADLTSGVSAGAHMTALTTLGLEGQLVSNVWEGTNGVTDSYIVDEAWIAGTYGKTTGKVGRMELDTPLVFTEKWSIAKNTFEAAVLINQDIPDTTVVGAYVGAGNGNAAVNGHGNGAGPVGFANVVQATGNAKGSYDGSTFTQFYNGAYAAGIINNSFKPLTAQAWYFDANQYLTAYWLQADLKMEGIMAGLQYTATNYTKSTELAIAKDADNNAVAVMLGYEMKDVATLKVAYSQTGTEKDSGFGLGAGANLASTGQSKLYTEAWWNYGYITQADTKAYNVTLESPVQGLFDLGVYYTASTTSDNGVPATADVDMREIAVTASKSFGPLDATLAVINVDADDQNVKAGNTTGDAYNMVQAYLTLNF